MDLLLALLIGGVLIRRTLATQIRRREVNHPLSGETMVVQAAPGYLRYEGAVTNVVSGPNNGCEVRVLSVLATKQRRRAIVHAVRAPDAPLSDVVALATTIMDRLAVDAVGVLVDSGERVVTARDGKGWTGEAKRVYGVSAIADEPAHEFGLPGTQDAPGQGWYLG